VLEAARAHRFELLLSVPLMLEYESVLTRPEHLAACAASREDVSAVLDELASFGKRVELMIRTRPMLPDPNDEMVLETAINGRADAIVTFNERDFRPVAARFRCSVVRPGEIVIGRQVFTGRPTTGNVGGASGGVQSTTHVIGSSPQA